MPTPVYSQAETDAIFVSLNNKVNDLTVRVNALEAGGGTVDPPPTGGDSPNGTVITVGGSLMHNGFKWEIRSDGRIYVDDVPDATTSNVVRLVRDDPYVAQNNAAGGWWNKKIPPDPWVACSPPAGFEPPIVPVGAGMQSNKGSAKPMVSSGPNAITADLTKTTGAIWNKAVSGCATGGLDNVTWDSQFRQLLDPAFQKACADLDFRFICTNGLGVVRNVFGANANSTTPNWTSVDRIIQGFDKTFPNAEFCMRFAGNGDFNYNDATIRNNLAHSIKAIVDRFRSQGLKIEYVGAINEPDAGTPTPKWSPAAIGASIAAMRSVMPNEKLAGPFTTYARGDFIKAAAQAGAVLITWHYYNHPNQAAAQRPPNSKIWDDAAAFNNAANAMREAAISGGVPNPICAVTEYNLDFTPGANNDPRQQSWEGAIYTSLLLMSGVYGGLAAATIWRSESWDAAYSPFKSGTLEKNPNGALLQALNKYMGGEVTPITLAANNQQKLLGICTRTPDHFTMMVTNYSGIPWTGPINLTGRSSTDQVTRFDLSPTYPLGLTGTTALSNVTIAQNSIAILSGTR